MTNMFMKGLWIIESRTRECRRNTKIEQFKFFVMIVYKHAK